MYDEARATCGACRHVEYCNGGCLYNMVVAERYNRPRVPFCNDEEGRVYRQLFDEISFRLAREEAGVMLGEQAPTPYLVMAGDKPRPGETARNKRLVARHHAWGKTGAPRHAFVARRRVDSVYLNITRNCPLRCSHCSVEAGEGFREMPLETALSITREAIALGYREVSLNGGEPFVYRHFPELVERLGEIPRAATRLALFTNLYRDMDDALAGKVMQVFDRVTVSLDGDTEEEHDARRGPGAFARTRANLLRLQAIPSRCRLAIRASLTPDQHRRGVGERVKELARQLGIRHVQVTSVFPLGRARGMEGVHELVPTPPVDAACFKRARPARNTCGIGSNLHVTCEGDIYPCWAFLDDGTPIGNVRDGLERATREYRLGNLHPYTVDASERCRACDVRYLCGGICRAYRAADCSTLRAALLEMVEMARE
jgi:uncharacterized protein